MGVTNTSDVRGGDMIILDGTIFEVVEFQHVKPGKGGAFVRLKIRNVKQGNTIDKTMNSGEKLQTPDIEEREMQFLYKSGNDHTFMDQSNFEQLTLSQEQLGESIKFLKPEMTINLMTCEGDVLGVQLPITVDLKVADTSPGFKGNTVSGSGKPATLETGFVLQVPFFVNVGDMVKVDTRTGEYLERS